jgi:tetratricopeptide (TPR) repeat protein
MSDRIRYVLALVVGLLAIPGLAFATSSVISADEPGESTGAIGSVATSTTAGSISAEDIVRGCGVEGYYLVELEAAAAIDEVQQAALNALRPICEEAGLPLPAAPIVEGETIVETVTVVRTVPGSAAAATKTPSTTTSTLGDAEGDASEAMLARERALAAIEQSIESGGNVEKINQAIALVDRGDAAYEAADYDQATELFKEAERTAIEAGLDVNDDHEDDEHEDDEHEDDEHEDEREDD